jgi:hypothetical protein
MSIVFMKIMLSDMPPICSTAQLSSMLEGSSSSSRSQHTELMRKETNEIFPLGVSSLSLSRSYSVYVACISYFMNGDSQKASKRSRIEMINS